MTIRWNEKGEAYSVQTPVESKKKRGRPRLSTPIITPLNEKVNLAESQENKIYGPLEEFLWPDESLPHNFQDFISKCNFQHCNASQLQAMAEQLSELIRLSRKNGLNEPIKIKKIPWGLRAQLARFSNNFNMDAAIFRDDSKVVEEDKFTALTHFKSFLEQQALEKHQDLPFQSLRQPGVGDHTWKIRMDHRNSQEK